MRFRHDPRKTFGQSWIGAFIAYVVMDVLFAALGMGVPLFCILFGFSVGWFNAMRATYFVNEFHGALKRSLRYAFWTSLVTVGIMTGVWGWLLPLMFHPVVNPGNMGLPLILYEPKASLIGWIVLMILLSPFAQFLMTLLGSYLTFLWLFRKKKPEVSSSEAAQ